MRGILDPQRSSTAVMSQETLQATINFFCSHQDEIEFVWHGGEPLLAGMQFYRAVGQLQTEWIRQGKKIANFVQTNGTLLNEEWAKLFAGLQFCVGVSLDAPPVIHDTLRVSRAGEGNLKDVLRGITHLRENGIFNGVSCCIGRQNYSLVKDIISFFLSCDIHSIKFLRIREPDSNAITADQYADFLIKIFHHWIDIDNPDLEIRDIKSIIDILLGGEFRECTLMGRCDQFVTVYNDGSIFPCDSLLNESCFCFGTVTESYSDVVERSNFQEFLQLSQRSRAACTSCPWNTLCHGGCLKDYVNGNKDTVCAANFRVFEEIQKTLISYGLLVG